MDSSFDHKQASASVFEGIYSEAVKLPFDQIPKPPDYWSEAILAWSRPGQNQTSAEVGCGSGYMSLALAERGYEVTLIDIAPSALALAKRVFDHHGRSCDLRLADLFQMDDSVQYDLVWNAGVMEHFLPEEIQQGLESMGRAVKPGGRMIILVPSARGRLYRYGKARLEAKGRWTFGVEYPIETLVPYSIPGFKVVAEDQVGVWSQSDPGLGCPSWLHKLVGVVTRKNETSPFWKKILGGYLLVSVFEKDI